MKKLILTGAQKKYIYVAAISLLWLVLFTNRELIPFGEQWITVLIGICMLCVIKKPHGGNAGLLALLLYIIFIIIDLLQTVQWSNSPFCI
jgi:hypothetical protein